jgi:hypothetical protein
LRIVRHAAGVWQRKNNNTFHNWTAVSLLMWPPLTLFRHVPEADLSVRSIHPFCETKHIWFSVKCPSKIAFWYY